jgi:hypothetical protein
LSLERVEEVRFNLHSLLTPGDLAHGEIDRLCDMAVALLHSREKGASGVMTQLHLIRDSARLEHFEKHHLNFGVTMGGQWILWDENLPCRSQQGRFDTLAEAIDAHMRDHP